MFTDLLLRQLTGDKPDLPAQRYNPRPAGVLRCQSASHAVYEVLRASPARWFSHGQLLQRTGKGTKALCWGLAYLQGKGLVESAQDGIRSERYRVYRLMPDAEAPTVSDDPRTQRVKP